MATIDRVENTLLQYGVGLVRPATEDASGYVVEPARDSVVAIRWRPAVELTEAVEPNEKDCETRHLQRCAAILRDSGFRVREKYGAMRPRLNVGTGEGLQ